MACSLFALILIAQMKKKRPTGHNNNNKMITPGDGLYQPHSF